jgi:hypothetical protein
VGAAERLAREGDVQDVHAEPRPLKELEDAFADDVRPGEVSAKCPTGVFVVVLWTVSCGCWWDDRTGVDGWDARSYLRQRS